MVLESLFNPFTVKQKPWQMFGAGFIYSIIGLGLSYFVFRDAASLLTVFLIVIAALPMIFVTIKNEEELDMKYDGEIKLLKEHTKVLIFLMFLFFGITVGLVLAYIILPQAVVDSVFSLQQQAIVNVNNNIHGSVLGFALKLDLFSKIFVNNIKVMFFCLIFSFLYGTGAIFILAWNASVIATAIGSLFKSELTKTASIVGLNSITGYFGAATLSFFRYMTHGFFEIAAYFVAGLAGGIISIALIKHNLKENRVILDSLDLVLISLALLFVAGIIEVYLTPVLFA